MRWSDTFVSVGESGTAEKLMFCSRLCVGHYGVPAGRLQSETNTEGLPSEARLGRAGGEVLVMRV